MPSFRSIILHPKNIFILLALLTIALGGLMPPAFVERFYSRGLVTGVQWMFKVLDSWLPFAGVYLLLVGLLAWMWRGRNRFFKSMRWVFWQGEGPFTGGWASLGRKLGRAAHSLLAFLAVVVILFQWLWGFNYGRVPLERQMGIEPRPLTVDELRDELLRATTDAVSFRRGLAEGPDSVIAEQKIVPSVEALMRQSLKSVLKQYHYPRPTDVRGRTVLPKGILLRFSTAGVYLPFTGEGHVDAGLHHLQLPYVLAHEMGHAYGHGDEGTCNSLAYLACIQSGDPYIVYIGHLYYWRYVASQYLAMAPDHYEQYRKALPAGLRADVRAINAEMEKYPDIMPKLRDAAYNTYLHSQGISEGMKNYDRVVMLVAAWRRGGVLGN
ncbi:MAG: DUF3810 domain-containing protein [Saprospiraceae bacterium]|nr:DUF3810 domain-containing protein [Saprospiraceae bacterium]